MGKTTTLDGLAGLPIEEGGLLWELPLIGQLQQIHTLREEIAALSGHTYRLVTHFAQHPVYRIAIIYKIITLNFL